MSTIILGYDPATLREIVDPRALAERLEELGNGRSTAVVNERAVLLRLAGRFTEALRHANEAVRLARFGGDREELVKSRIRRAVVLQQLGQLDRAHVDLSDCVTEAGAHDWQSTEAFALQHRGKVAFDREDFAAAMQDFRDALTIRIRIRASSDQIDSSMFAIAVAERRLQDGAPLDADRSPSTGQVALQYTRPVPVLPDGVAPRG